MKKITYSLCLTMGIAFATQAIGQGTEVPLSGISADPTAPVEVSADSLSIDQSDGSAVFSGNVVAGQGALRLSANEVRVEYAAEDGENPGQILRIHATGEVILVTGDEQAKGESAIYDLDKQLVTMKGEVILTQGRNAVSGDEMVFDLGASKARFIGRVRTILQTGDGG